MVIIFQTLVVAIGLLAAWSVVTKHRQGLLARSSMMLWLLCWSGVLLATIWPESISKVAEMLGIGRGVDLVVYVAILLLFFLIFRTQIHIERLERHITKLTREKALEDTPHTPAT